MNINITILQVWVPKPDQHKTIRQGSAIVSSASCVGDDIDIYYEGNLYGAANVITFADRVLIAAGRLLEHYPTVARARAPESTLELVGFFEYETKELTVTDPVPLAQWLGVEQIDMSELEVSRTSLTAREAQARAMAKKLIELHNEKEGQNGG